MWNDHHEHVGKQLRELLRATHGEHRPLIETPAHLFESDEVVEAQILLVLAILMSWDAYLVPDHGEFFVFNSHHEYIDVISKNLEIHERLLMHLKNWEPRPGA
jgi:hypothetical protein